MNLDKFIPTQQSCPPAEPVQPKKNSDYSIEGK